MSDNFLFKDFEMHKFYYAYALEKNVNTQKFLKNKIIHNIKNNTFFYPSYSLKNKTKKDYFYYRSKTEFMNNLYIDKKSLFITITLNQKLFNVEKGAIQQHSDDILYPNSTTFAGYNFNSAYKQLNQFFRKFCNVLYANKLNYKYVLVCEPHKTGFPHFHILFYCLDDEVNGVSSDKFVRDKLYQYRKVYNEKQGKNYIGRIQAKILDKTDLQANTAVTNYVMKYLQKTLASDNVFTTALIRTGLQSLLDAGHDYTDGETYLYCSPAAYMSAISLQDFYDASRRGDGVGPIASGAVGMVYGIPTFVSTDWDDDD